MFVSLGLRYASVPVLGEKVNKFAIMMRASIVAIVLSLPCLVSADSHSAEGTTTMAMGMAADTTMAASDAAAGGDSVTAGATTTMAMTANTTMAANTNSTADATTTVAAVTATKTADGAVQSTWRAAACLAVLVPVLVV